MPHEIVYCTHSGKTGYQQQDAMLVSGVVIQDNDLPVTTESVTTEDLLLAVADGVAASPSARQASRIVVEELARSLIEHRSWCQSGLITGRHLRRVHQRLCERLAGKRNGFGASSTIATVHLCAEHWVALNVGDSRVYLASAETGWRQLSQDHTLLQDMIARGEAKAGEEYASIYHSLSHCLIAEEEESHFAIHMKSGCLQPDEVLVLCTDGVHDTLDAADWPTWDTSVEDPLTQLVAAFHQQVLVAGAPDNFSIIAARLLTQVNPTLTEKKPRPR